MYSCVEICGCVFTLSILFFKQQNAGCAQMLFVIKALAVATALVIVTDAFMHNNELWVAET